MSSASSSSHRDGADAAAAAVASMQLQARDASAADDSEERDLSLAAHFYKCQRTYTNLLVNGTMPRTVATCTELRRSLLSLLRRIESVGLFSSNETAAEDLSTSSIKFLLVPFFLGQLASSFPCDIPERVTHVKAGAVYFAQFMRRLDAYGLVQDGAEMETFTKLNKELGAALSAPPPSASAASSRPPMPGMRGSRGGDPNAIRTAKIARMRRSKELGSQLEAMQQTRKSTYQKKKAANIVQSSSATADDDAGDDLLDTGGEESEVRAFYLLLIQQAVFATVDATKSALDESEMLLHYMHVESRKPRSEQLSQMDPEERRDEARDSGKKLVAHRMTPDSLNQPVPAHMKHLLQNVAQPAAASGSGSGSSSLSASSLAAARSAASAAPAVNSIDRMIGARSGAREQVFALTNQPTMSIEQWAEAEIAAGHMAGPSDNRQPRGPDPRRIRSQADRDTAEEMVAAFHATQDPDNDELGHEDGAAGAAKDEIKTQKDREWDNWKDEHQKGVGNSLK